ncbi:MAG TPA: ABC transporter permease [Puia sp.]|jgi:ABC-type dipeptide/oligopeptide/nickel transport system permease subunit|nr:ABC transporter permease [Puia sp.]
MTTPGQHIRKRLLRNSGALFGLTIISLSILIAVFAYFLAPDGSPDANRIIVEIGGRSPGFRQLFLPRKKERRPPAVGFVHQLLFGREDAYDYIPINSYFLKGDSLIVEKYVDEGVEERRAYPRSVAFLQSAPGRDPYGMKTMTFWLGTDKYGRDILSRLLIGVRVSLAVGLVTVLLSLTIGVLLGALAGYFRGRIDEIILWLINVIWSIPTLLLVFAIMLLLGKGFWQVFIAIGLTLWVNVARIVRGQVLAIREREFVEAARALGYSNPRILFRHMLPNVMGPVWVVAASNFASAIVIEAGLSFLGVGVQPPQPSWGLMIKENYNFIITHNPMLALAPGLAIMVLVLAFNLLGNSLRDILDVRV